MIITPLQDGTQSIALPMRIVLSLVALGYAALGHRVAVFVVCEDGEAGERGGQAEQSEDRP